MLKKLHRLVLASILIILTITFRPSFAADYNQVGVRVGDTADYDAQLSSPSDVNRLHIDVYGIVGTTVYLNLTYYFRNGTLYSASQVTGDINIGTLFFYLYLITPNLQVGDAIYSGASATIDKTNTMTIAGASRSVNHYNDSSWDSWDSYWDQTTGLTVKLTYWIMGWTNLTLTSTSLWSGGLPLPVIIQIGGISLLIFGMITGFFIGRRGGEKKEMKKKKRKK